MATVTYIPYKSGRNSTPSAMQAVMRYCLQPSKTELSENCFCVSGQDCTPSLAYQEFMATKAAFHKENGVFFHHYVQSFSPDEIVTPEEANAIGKEFANRAFPGFEVLIATHIDREHIHSHLIVNSVHAENGKKYHSGPDTLKKLRAISDDICHAHGLSVLPPYESGKKEYIPSGEYRTALRCDSWKFRLMAAVTEAMKVSFTKDTFIENMKMQGYDVLWTDARKSITYTCLCEPKFKNGNYRKCRDTNMHEEKYRKQNMEEEFYAREKWYEKIVGRTADADEWDENTHRTKRNENRYGAMGNGQREHQHPLSGAMPNRGKTEKSAFQNGSDGLPFAIFDGKHNSQSGESCQESGGHCTEGSRRTGWESSRAFLRIDGQTCRTQRGSMVAQTDILSHSQHRNYSLAGTLFGLAGGLISATPEESEEAKKQREAENTGSALGVAAGIAISLAQKAANDVTEGHETESESTDTDEEFGPVL